MYMSVFIGPNKATFGTLVLRGPLKYSSVFVFINGGDEKSLCVFQRF